MKKDEQFDKGDLQWQLRVSSKARYARLRILPFGGLEVVIPTRFPRKLVAGLVAEHADWARHQLARQAHLQQHDRPGLAGTVMLYYSNRPDTFPYDDELLPVFTVDHGEPDPAFTRLAKFFQNTRIQ